MYVTDLNGPLKETNLHGQNPGKELSSLPKHFTIKCIRDTLGRP